MNYIDTPLGRWPKELCVWKWEQPRDSKDKVYELLGEIRHSATSILMNKIKPLLKQSVYDQPVCRWKDRKCKSSLAAFSIKEIYGFVADGVIADCPFGPMLTKSFKDMPVEDILLMEEIFDKFHKELE